MLILPLLAYRVRGDIQPNPLVEIFDPLPAAMQATSRLLRCCQPGTGVQAGMAVGQVEETRDLWFAIVVKGTNGGDRYRFRPTLTQPRPSGS